MLSNINRGLTLFEEGITAFLFALATILAFLEVVLRYVFNNSLGSMELVIFSLIWASLIGASSGIRHGVHIHVEILVDRLPEGLRRKALVVSLAISAAFTFFMFVYGLQLVGFTMQRNEVTPEMQVPMWPVFIVVPLSTGLMTIRFCQEIYYVLTRRFDREPLEVYGEDVEGGPVI